MFRQLSIDGAFKQQQQQQKGTETKSEVMHTQNGMHKCQNEHTTITDSFALPSLVFS